MRRKPNALHKLHGTYKASRHDPKPAAAPVGLPRRPEHLGADEAAAWDELATAAEAAAVVTTSDAAVLEVAACALAEMRLASATLREEGATYTTRTPSGSDLYRPHPAQQIRADAQRRLLAALGALGLTPTTRGRAEVAQPSEPSNRFAKFFSGPTLRVAR